MKVDNGVYETNVSESLESLMIMTEVRWYITSLNNKHLTLKPSQVSDEYCHQTNEKHPSVSI